MKNENSKLEEQEYGKKTESVENETQTLYDLEYGEKNWKTKKMRNAHCRSWSMARKQKIMENEKHTL